MLVRVPRGVAGVLRGCRVKPCLEDGQVSLYLGDCLEVLAAMEPSGVDAVVCDPPYGLAGLSAARALQAIAAWMAGDRAHVPDGRGFMGREWDSFVPPPAAWDECMRALKPGGYLLAFAGSRTVDLMTLSIRIAGFSVLDSITWIYGSGWPKSKTALKPAHEPIVLARKPLAAKSLAANVLEHGTGALAIDACRVAHTSAAGLAESEGKNRHADFGSGPRANEVFGDMGQHDRVSYDGSAGRWPPNVLLTHSAGCEMTGTRLVRGNQRSNPTVQQARVNVAKGAERQRARGRRGVGNPDGTETVGAWACAGDCPVAALDAQGNSSRYFPVTEWAPGEGVPFLYQAKASPAERPRLEDGTAWPTVKPVALMRWLVRLVTPPGGLVLDPFAGTGTTAEAAALEGFRCLLIEKDPVAAELAVARLSKPIQPDLFGGAA